MRSYFSKTAVLFFGLIAVFAFSGMIFAWTDPSTSAPGGNIAPPINISPSNQTKSGNLSVGTGLSYWITKSGDSFALNNNAGATKLVIGQDGNVGIGTASPVYKLEVVGDISWTGTLYNGSIPADRITSGELNEARVRKLESADTRSTNPDPESYTSAVQADFKTNAIDGLTDGGTYHGVISYRPYGSAADYSGGPMHQLGFTGNGNLWERKSTGSTTWGSWYQIARDQMTNNFSFMGNVGIGTASPGAKLEVAGQVKITGGTPGAGKVLTSDADGLATWQALAGGVTYSTLSGIPVRTAWSGIHRGFVAEQLSWKNYGNGHTIFDASNGTSPDGVAVNNTNSQVVWSATYPTLMGWNGSNTYGVRVDSARLADNATLAGGLAIATGRNNVANQIARTDANGYLQTGYINSSNGDEGNNSSPVRIWGTNGSDSYLRTYLTSALTVGNADTTDGFHLNQAVTSGANPQWGTTYANNWFRSQNASGWYSETYGGGIWMQNSDYVEVYGGKGFRVPAGKAAFTRDGVAECCGNDATIALGEATSSTGRKASISFHNSGAHEGTFELTASGERRFVMRDNQGALMGLEATGNIRGQAFYYTSDGTLKKDVSPIDNSLDKIEKLNGVYFKWKSNDESSIGLIAQDVEKVFPEAVSTNSDTGLKSVDYGKLVAPLIEAVKAQQEQIDTLKASAMESDNLAKTQQAKIEALEASGTIRQKQIDDLETEIKELKFQDSEAD